MKPSTRYVVLGKFDLDMRVACERSGVYVAELCLRAAYLTVSRPDEMQKYVEMLVGKRKRGQAVKINVIKWSDELRAVINEASALQRATSMYVCGNSDGQPYTTRS